MMAVTPLVRKLTREETLERLYRMQSPFNRETGEPDSQSYSSPIDYSTTEKQREHWRKLHTQTFDATTFEAWVAAIPGCSACQMDFRKIIETFPPDFERWNRWTWEIHNAVNRKLGKPELSWLEACELWGW